MYAFDRWRIPGNSCGIHVDPSHSLGTYEALAFDIDPDYYSAYYAKNASNLMWSSEAVRGKVLEGVEERITSKWEKLPTKQTFVKTPVKAAV